MPEAEPNQETTEDQNSTPVSRELEDLSTKEALIPPQCAGCSTPNLLITRGRTDKLAECPGLKLETFETLGKVVTAPICHYNTTLRSAS